MSSYNIIYTSVNKDKYLWSGEKFERLKSKGDDHLYFSGKTFKHDELEKELKLCRKAASSIFNDDAALKIMPVEIKVSK